MHTHPELYDSFLKNHFVVKRTSGSFNAVSPDLALEQTIQRSSKSSHGIIGQTRKQEYAAEWALIYHEVLSITNTFREITNWDKGGNTETANASSHHHLSHRKIQEINARTDSISSYVRSQENPFCKENHDKDHVTAAKSDATEKTIKKNERASRLAIKVLSVAKSKDGDLARVLKYDITNYSMILQTTVLKDGSLMVKPIKNKMREELEKKASIKTDDLICNPSNEEAVVVDFMSFIRGLSLDIRFKDLKAPSLFGIQDNPSTWTFGMMVAEAFARVFKRFPDVALFHIVFDSYIENSLKDGERATRIAAAGGIIRLARTRSDTKVPEQMPKFWACSANKENSRAL